MRNALFLATDAFGGYGGIAEFNQAFIQALSRHERVERILLIPRLKCSVPESLSSKIICRNKAGGSVIRFIFHLFLTILFNKKIDAIFCGHIHLLPFALWAKRRSEAPLYLIMHGIEVWGARRRHYALEDLNQIDGFISVSEFTRGRFLEIHPLEAANFFILPNSIYLKAYKPAAKNKKLIDRYGLSGKKVLLSLGRLEALERELKGYDKVIEILPALVKQNPDLVYVLAGEGSDRDYLRARAKKLKVADHLRFTGYIDTKEKSQLLQLADVFVLPSKGEGFGIVLIEALASGLTVVGSNADASREVLKSGELGYLVDPDDLNELKETLMRALREPKVLDFEKLKEYDRARFQENVFRLVESISA